MSRVFFRKELENVASFWRIFRKDGVALGFTTHDRDLYFGGIQHRAAPGMLPSSIRRSADLTDDAADITGALSHDTVSAEALSQGRFDDARIIVGAVDWTTLEHTILYAGSIGSVRKDANAFTAELRSAKAALEFDPIPRTSPTCRAKFCGPQCTLSALRFTSEAALVSANPSTNRLVFAGVDAERHKFGLVRWIDGPLTGMTMSVRAVAGDALVVDRQLPEGLEEGYRALLREGCDRRLETCAGRFGNAANFQGEPFLPGNDLLAQYPVAR